MSASATTMVVYSPVPEAKQFDLQGLDTTTAWAELSEAARGPLLEELLTRFDNVDDDDWKLYTATSCQLDLTGEWWRGGGWAAFDALLVRVSKALGRELRAGEILEVEDRFVLLTQKAVWRPMLSTRFAAQLHHLGQGREPPRSTRPASTASSRSVLAAEKASASDEHDEMSWPAPLVALQPLVLDVITKAQVYYEPLLESLPPRHRTHARCVVEEFLHNDLGKGLARCDLTINSGKLRALRKLLSLAVEREAIVTITYRQDVLGPALKRHPELRRVMVRIWDDEVYHEVYFRMVQDRALRSRLDRISGLIGGRAAAVLANEGAGRLARLPAEAVKIGGRIVGKLGSEAARGMGPASPAAYCSHNVALEVTACLAYNAMAVILMNLSG